MDPSGLGRARWADERAAEMVATVLAVPALAALPPEGDPASPVFPPPSPLPPSPTEPGPSTPPGLGNLGEGTQGETLTPEVLYAAFLAEELREAAAAPGTADADVASPPDGAMAMAGREPDQETSPAAPRSGASSSGASSPPAAAPSSDPCNTIPRAAGTIRSWRRDNSRWSRY